MKNLKKLIILAIFSLQIESLFAENKQQIRLSNQYGPDVLIHLVWRQEKKPHLKRTQDIILKGKRKNFLVKAPISGYHLLSIEARPAKGILIAATVAPVLIAGGIAAGAAVVPYAASGSIIASMSPTAGAATMGVLGGAMGADLAMVPIMEGLRYSHNIHAHGNNFFVIERLKDNEKTKKFHHTVERINIKGYASQKHYEGEIAKNSPAQKIAAAIVSEQPVEVVNNESNKDYQDVTAANDQAASEESIIVESDAMTVNNQQIPAQEQVVEGMPALSDTSLTPIEDLLPSIDEVDKQIAAA